jgi:hypothetical protein
MKRLLILWGGALLLTFLTGYVQSGTSKYYPVTGTIGIDAKKVSYKFDKIYKGKENYNFIIRTDVPMVEGIVKWRNQNSSAWNTNKLKKNENVLYAEIPAQEAGDIILYYVKLFKDDRTYNLPWEPVTLLFLGYVPPTISFLSFFTLFGGLFLSFRIGLEFFNENQKIKKLSLFAVSFFFLYSIAVTPLRKSYELNAINNRVVPITDLFDLQSIVLFVLWIVAMITIFKMSSPKKPALIFSILTALVFLFVRV